MKLFFIFIISFCFCFIFFSLVFMLFFSLYLEGLEKSSPFECGFSSISGLGVIFSMPFFVISTMFLLFDVEILILCVYPLFYLSSFYVLMFIYFVLIIVITSTLFEWLKGILDWF
uniref:NADH-ubiquinone oxidoreductase chain 3 n=1 Tax=Histiostoma blomquisti TaxID=1902798 RepID=A0A342Y124_9ACAR|nr:NADH dehydrogenase subunit 3 [Histiostoma blomquisti]AOR08476.1 NADH dehydrogenase subunit 3 [Histiostoma blomquisti]